MRFERYMNEASLGVKQWHDTHIKRGTKGTRKPEGWYFEEMWNDYILDDCKPYLQLMKKTGMIEPLFRSHNVQGGIMDNEIHAFSTIKDRKPKGMDKKTFDAFNKWLQKNGHARRDKSISTTPLREIALDHGSPRHVWPMGKFKYTYILGAGDINSGSQVSYNYGTEYTEYHPEFIYRMIFSENKEDKEHARDIIEKNISSTNFKKGVSSGSEIWIECDNFYITSTAAWDGLREFYKKL